MRCPPAPTAGRSGSAPTVRLRADLAGNRFQKNLCKTTEYGAIKKRYKAYEDWSDNGYKYKTESVSGLGDEAYLVVESRDGGEKTSSVTLAVREGWFTYQVVWSSYAGSSSKAEPPTADEITEMLKSDTRASLAAYKKS